VATAKDDPFSQTTNGDDKAEGAAPDAMSAVQLPPGRQPQRASTANQERTPEVILTLPAARASAAESKDDGKVQHGTPADAQDPPARPALPLLRRDTGSTANHSAARDDQEQEQVVPSRPVAVQFPQFERAPVTPADRSRDEMDVPALTRSASEGRNSPADAPRDEMVVPAQAPGIARTPTPTQDVAPDGTAQGFLAPPESLPIGEHSAGLTVSALAPQAVNMNTKAVFWIVVKNTGTTDVQGVVVREQLADGLELLESTPPVTTNSAPLLQWVLGTVPANAERRIQLSVKPTKKMASVEHAAFVTVLTGSRAHVVVREPKLRVVARPTTTRVLKGHQAKFEITVTNPGTGAARDVMLRANLTSGLKHEEGFTIELPFKSLNPPRSTLAAGAEVSLDLVVDAVMGGEQSCTITAVSPDVPAGSPESQVVSTVQVVEPKLELKVKAPKEKSTGSVATFQLIIENKGTATAKRVRAAATLPPTGGSAPFETQGQWNAQARRLAFGARDIEPNQVVTLPFNVKLGGESLYRIDAVALGDGLARLVESASTKVSGRPQMRMAVREQKDVIDVNEQTVFTIRVVNNGSADATNVLVSAQLSDQLEAVSASGMDGDEQAQASKNQVRFPQLKRMSPGEEKILTIQVRAIRAGIAACRVVLADDQSDNTNLEGSARVRVVDPNAAQP
jgi:uncharacterized repeat protein (TIGR01451 family)